MNTNVIDGRGVTGATVASYGLINYEDVMTTYKVRCIYMFLVLRVTIARSQSPRLQPR